MDTEGLKNMDSITGSFITSTGFPRRAADNLRSLTRALPDKFIGSGQFKTKLGRFCNKNVVKFLNETAFGGGAQAGKWRKARQEPATFKANLATTNTENRSGKASGETNNSVRDSLLRVQ